MFDEGFGFVLLYFEGVSVFAGFLFNILILLEYS